MAESAEARKYLGKALADKHESLSRISLELGYAATYLQQHINRASPPFLKERDRKLLVKLCDYLDEECLKPPHKEPTPLPPRKRDLANRDAKLGAELANEFLDAQFSDLWAGLGSEGWQAGGLRMWQKLDDNGKVAWLKDMWRDRKKVG